MTQREGTRALEHLCPRFAACARSGRIADAGASRGLNGGDASHFAALEPDIVDARSRGR